MGAASLAQLAASVLATATSPSCIGRWCGVVDSATAQRTCTLTRSATHSHTHTHTRSVHDYLIQYGDPNNSSRPGGPQTQAAFFSTTTNSTFHVVSDNSTVVALIASISANCTFASNSSKTPSTFNGAATDPLPEQAIQYYRASSVVLTLDGYNDTVALTGAENATAPPLPSNVDKTLLDCLNSTIGAAVPLFEDAASSLPMPSVGLVGLAYVLWCLSSFF